MAAPVQADVETVFKAVVVHSVNDVLRSLTFIFACRDVEAAKLHLNNLIAQRKLKFPRVSSLTKWG